MTETIPALGELKLRILLETREGHTRLKYEISSREAGFTDWPIQGPALLGSPEDFCVDLLRRMEDLGAGRGVGGEVLLQDEVVRKLANLGRELYQTLFPPEMRQAYRIFRKSVHTVSIISDEPWIPWEMIKAYDDSEPELIDDDFLCVQFQVTRWLSGKTAAPTEIAIPRLACVMVPSSLPSAAAESRRVRDLARAHSETRDVSPESPTWEAVVKLLEGGGIGLLHFVGHGDFDRARPNQSAIPLADGRALLPEDLQGTVRTQLRRDRPFVFLNACRVGQQSWALTGLGGWAHRWIQECGCSGFIGPHWAVRDSGALEFATAFYDAIERGETFGQASRTARLAARANRPADPTWLAYAVYANPLGSLRFPDTPLKRKTFEEFVHAVESERASRSTQVTEEKHQAAAPEALHREIAPASANGLHHPASFERFSSTKSESVSGPSEPAPAPETKAPLTSSNLRIKQKFTDRDRDRFVEETFDYTADFFESSLGELQQHYPNIEGIFRRVDRNRFESAVYREGKKENSCRIWISRGSMGMGDIAYADQGSWGDNSYGESLTAQDDGYSLLLRPLGLRTLGSSNQKPLTRPEAAEFLWAMLIKPLQ